MNVSRTSCASTKNRLLEAALFCFSEHGYEGTGIRDIAKRAHVNSAMVQYHFGGKEGLYKAAMSWIFDLNATLTKELPSVPDPQDPQARALAIQALSEHLRILQQDLQGCYLPADSEAGKLNKAGKLLWSREMQFPSPFMIPFILETIRPYVDNLCQCIRVLRPDLDEDGVYRMGISIHGQFMYLHDHFELMGLLRGTPYHEADLETLLQHFIQFSIRGLHIPDSDALQGA